LGILNSQLVFFLFKHILPKLRGDFYEPSYVYFKDFPIRVINFDHATDKKHYDQMVQWVDQMLDFNQQLEFARDPQTKRVLTRQIEAIDRQIDQLVYALYDLTAEEIAIIERNANFV
jgi:hypothetical protein